MERQSGRTPSATCGELPPEALLTADEVGEWLKVARRQVQRLEIPWIDLGRKTPRYQGRTAPECAREARAFYKHLTTRKRRDQEVCGLVIRCVEPTHSASHDWKVLCQNVCRRN